MVDKPYFQIKEIILYNNVTPTFPNQRHSVNSVFHNAKDLVTEVNVIKDGYIGQGGFNPGLFVNVFPVANFYNDNNQMIVLNSIQNPVSALPYTIFFLC